MEDQMADEDVVVTLSHDGYVKRMPMHLYRRRTNSGKALAGMERYDEDYLERIFTARTQGWILCFTEGGHCHFLPVLDVPESARASRGQSAYALMEGADRSDRIVAMIPVDDLEVEERWLLFVSRGGLVKRTGLPEFSNPRAGGLIAAGVRDGDGVMDVVLTDGTAEIMLLNGSGRAIRFSESDVSTVGRTAQGVKGMDLEDDDQVVGMLLIRRDATVATLTEQGMGKRVPVGDFPLQKRGGKGTLAIPSGGSGGKLVAALEVLEADQVMLISAGGAVNRVRAESIPLQGRRTQGKRIVKLPAGDRIVEVTRTSGGEGAPEPAGAVATSDEDDEDQLDLLG